MNDIIKQILKLRNNKDFQIDSSNSNKYRIVAFEEDGSKTAYCFSSPIYDIKTRSLLNTSFNIEKEKCVLNGSNTTITVGNSIIMKNEYGTCCVSSNEGFEDAKISPTLNGLLFHYNSDSDFAITLSVDCNLFGVRANNKSFSVMLEKFKPLITVSCIGIQNSEGEIIAPVELSYSEVNTRAYSLSFAHDCGIEGEALFEINMHDIKLFQDTTVESGHSKENNAFGGTAFLGHSKNFGEQWLYTRPDWSAIPDLMNVQIKNVLFHIPKLNSENTPLVMFSAFARFCSFGSTWDNKIPISEEKGDSFVTDRFHSFNVTDVVKDKLSQKLKAIPGMIIKPKNKSNTFSVISTADSCFMPQIIEINYM